MLREKIKCMIEKNVQVIKRLREIGKEILETQQGHIMVESGKFINKHGVAILLNRRWKNQINWVQSSSERVVALSISVNKQPTTLVSVYMPHSGYPDHHIEKTYKTILSTIGKEKGMKIIGGDFNAELGPGEGIELSSVGHYTLNKANCRGEWMTQWLLDNSFVALNTMYKKIPQKQVTYYTPKKVKKQLDYVLTGKKHYPWSRDAEANDTIHMGSDHRCVMAKFEIPRDKGKSRHTKAPKSERETETCEDGNEQKYRDLEQEVKEAEPGTRKESTKKSRQIQKRRQRSRSQKRERMKCMQHQQRHSQLRQQQMVKPSQRLTRKHLEEQSHRKCKKRQKNTKKSGPSYKKGRLRPSTKKSESVKSAKRSKNISGKTKGRKDKKEFRRSWKSQRNKKHSQYQISEETNPYPKGQRQRRRNHQDKRRNCQRFC